jgi:6 kDa early secretory antigenic target
MADTDDLAVTPEVLRTTAHALSGESKNLDDILAALTQRVNVLQANWDGNARAAYADAQRQWSAALDDMREVLGRIATSTLDIADGYTGADRKAAGRFTHRA